MGGRICSSRSVPGRCGCGDRRKREGPWKCRAMESLESPAPVSHPSHSAWKSLPRFPHFHSLDDDHIYWISRDRASRLCYLCRRSEVLPMSPAGQRGICVVGRARARQVSALTKVVGWTGGALTHARGSVAFVKGRARAQRAAPLRRRMVSFVEKGQTAHSRSRVGKNRGPVGGMGRLGVWIG